MIAVNIILMTAVATGIFSLLSWAIVSDRRSSRAAAGELAPAAAQLHHDLVMPHELRIHRGASKAHAARGPQLKTSSPA